jgi:ABC-2 type transport system ATP-binding protein
MVMSNAVLKTQGLAKHFGSVRAVDGVDLTVHQGEVFGFLGPNGAGKTTTIGMLLGLIHPTAGRVELLGEPVSPRQTAPLRRVGSLMGVPGLVPYLSGRDNLGLLARFYPGVDRERVQEVLDQVDLNQAAGRQVGKYSSGMKQRLGLAAALLHYPELLVLDEPTNGLDPAGMREVRGLLRVLADNGVTVFLSSHLLHEVEQVCDRVAVLNRGRIIAEGPVADLAIGEPLLRLRVASPSKAIEALRDLPGVRAVAGNGNWVELRGAASEAVVAHLVARGIVPAEIREERPDLEALFLQLTEEPVLP